MDKKIIICSECCQSPKYCRCEEIDQQDEEVTIMEVKDTLIDFNKELRSKSDA